MTNDSTNNPKWTIGSGCPEGAMYIGSDGEPKITPYGLGYLAAEFAKEQKQPLVEAILYASKVSANHFAGCLDRGHSEEEAKKRADEVLASAKMRLEELYRGASKTGGRA
ncbi:hypothetical protein AA18889_0313 [Acetobacter senegalensis DSM 18889]|nr:hypothetical protein AA18889_0313 [Acetobacter senegalensis DSM 18889]